MPKKKSGFTLIELIVVMAILAILAAWVMGNFFTSQKKARDLQRKSDLKQIGQALELYFNDLGKYPGKTATGNRIDGCGAGGVGDCAWGTSTFSNTTPNPDVIYMIQVPKDPRGGLYYYDTDANGTYYQLYARFENAEDPDIPQDPSENNQKYQNTDCNSAGIDCNYGISSTNQTPITNHTLILE